MQTAKVELIGISKSFPGVVALDGVDIAFQPGEVHALLGENGAGKSTLIKIMTGALSRDSGSVLMDGAPIELDSPAAAQAVGIGAVYQEVNLIATQTVAANLTLERQPRRFGFISWRRAAEDARAALARLDLSIDVERPLGAYSLAVQHLVAIARALRFDTRVLVLDEPTASLDAREVERLFAILRDLKAKGLAIVFITHFLDQVYQIADRITVLRNGRRVGAAPTSALPQVELVSLMLGHELQAIEARGPAAEAKADGEPALSVKGLGAKRVMAPFDLELRAGDVLGLAGLLGSGRTETAKLVFGATPADEGTIRVDGRAVSIRTPRQAIRLGVGFCPEDRKREGLMLDLTVRENIILALQSKRGWLRRLPRQEQEKLASEMIRALAIATPDAERPVGQLSGGNQQKVILARWLVSNPRVLILDEPTRGIDVGAHAEIVALIRRLCAEGMALLVASSELDEIVAFSTRVAVLRDRRKIAEITGAHIQRDDIVQAIAAP
ncbi:MAG TPA: sugar ABC transporter ATP-binding protein [Roseiarcus sp.]|nr:sugar ABC transporter ATP-binding protein [Roseiarcus sp.]